MNQQLEMNLTTDMAHTRAERVEQVAHLLRSVNYGLRASDIARALGLRKTPYLREILLDVARMPGYGVKEKRLTNGLPVNLYIYFGTAKQVAYMDTTELEERQEYLISQLSENLPSMSRDMQIETEDRIWEIGNELQRRYDEYERARPF